MTWPQNSADRTNHKTDVKALYEKLGTVISSIHARNEWARLWLDKLVLKCHVHSKSDLDRYANAACIESLRYDFEIVLIIQGSDEQKALYRELESLIHQLAVASGL